MDKKCLSVSAVAFVIALVIGIAIGSQIVSPQAGPPVIDRNFEVNAHRCQADGTCEMNSAKIENNVEIGLIRNSRPDFDLYISKPSNPANLILDGWTNAITLGLNDPTESILTLNGGQKSMIQIANNRMFWEFELTDKTDDLVIKDGFNQDPRIVIKRSDNVEILGGAMISGGLSTDFLSVDQKLHIAEEVEINAPTRFSNLGGTRPAYACLDTLGYIYRSETPCV